MHLAINDEILLLIADEKRLCLEACGDRFVSVLRQVFGQATDRCAGHVSGQACRHRRPAMAGALRGIGIHRQ
jgi:hypothetical protein